MSPTILVVTTVHWPDDTRIRERLIRTISTDFEVVYASRSPGPEDTSDLTYRELKGGRFRRNLHAIALGLTADYDMMVIHDPELLPAGVLARLLRRLPVVFDVHEDIPASAYTRAWVPQPMRRALSGLMAWTLRLVEPVVTITLAEPGYRRLFRGEHPCFPNYPDTTAYPEAGGDAAGPVVYLGDITHERGADIAVASCSALGVPLRLVGRISHETRARLERDAGTGELLSIEGLVPNRTAIRHLKESSVGLAPLLDLPNYRHSQPTKILEYLAMGLPVAASDLPGTRELVAGLDAVFLAEPGNVAALTEAISKARTTDAAERARAQAAEVRARFKWPREQVREFYRSLV